MTDLVPPLQDDPPPSRLRGLFSAIVRRGGWAITDQAVVSIGNFGRDVIFAAYLTKEIYGAYGMVMSPLLLIGSLHAALIIYPVQVRGAVVDAERLPKLATASLILTLLLSLPLLVLMGLATVYAIWDAHIAIGWTTVSTIGFLLLFQFQELSRRTLMARLRFAAAVPGDSIVYLGQMGLLAFLGSTGWLSGTDGLARGFLIMTLMTILGALIQTNQVGFARIGLEDMRTIWREFWKLGKWMAAANLTTVVTDVGYNWMLGKAHTLADAGDYRVIGQLNKLINPVMLTMIGLIVPVVAKTKSGSNTRFAKRVGMKYAAVGMVMISSYLLILLIVPELPLWLFYRNSMDIANGVRLFAFTSMIGLTATMILAVLNGLGRPQAQFWTQLTNTAVSLVIGLPLTLYFGLWGALWGGLVASIALTSVAVVMFQKTR